MKTVVQNPYHFWANETQSHARNASNNRSFRYGKAYSYATVVATVNKNKKGERLFLLTSWHYSITTSRHMSEIQSAIPYGERKITVPNVETIFREDTAHKENVRWFWEQVEEAENKAERARVAYMKDYWRDRAVNLLADLTFYIEFFGLKGYKKPTGTQVGQAEAALAAQRKRDALELKKAEAERKKWIAEKLEEQRESIQEWIAGERQQPFYGLPFQYLRIVDPSQWGVGEMEVETTQQAIVPLVDVQRALPAVMRILASGKAFKSPPGESIMLGGFRLTEITAEGVVTVGCHRFERSEIERFAKVLEGLS